MLEFLCRLHYESFILINLIEIFGLVCCSLRLGVAGSIFCFSHIGNRTSMCFFFLLRTGPRGVGFFGGGDVNVPCNLPPLDGTSLTCAHQKDSVAPNFMQAHLQAHT